MSWLGLWTGLAGSSCLIQPDCDDTFRGVHHGDVLETTLDRLESSTDNERLGSPPCGGAVQDVGGSFRWKVHIDGPGDGCGDRFRVELIGDSATTGPSGARLPSGCTGTWLFEVLLRGEGSILEPAPAGAPPRWLVRRQFAEKGPAGSCNLAGNAAPRCADLFVASARPAP
jgi:hypothetical protein